MLPPVGPFFRSAVRFMCSLPKKPPKKAVDTRSKAELLKAQQVVLEVIAAIHSGKRPPSSSLGKLSKVLSDEIYSPEEYQNRCKKAAYEWKNKVNLNNIKSDNYTRLIDVCFEKLGADATLDIVGKVGQDTSLEEYNTAIRLCIKKAKAAKDEDTLRERISKAYQLLTSMKEKGFQLEEETYGQFLKFLIDMKMVEDFRLFYGLIRHENPNSLPRLSYYEMLLSIELHAGKKIEERCRSLATNDEENSTAQGNYLVALCESGRTEEFMMLLETIDITKISSMDLLATIFRSLSRFSLESHMKNFIVALRGCDIGAENISKLICHYVITVPTSAVEDAIFKFGGLHKELEVMPVSESYEKLIGHCCTLQKVYMALDIVERMFEVGLTLSLKTVHLILQKCEESCDYNLVHWVYSIICRNKLKPTNEIFRIMIKLSMQMKDIEGAYTMLKDMGRMSLKPTANIYNTIIAALFREKRTQDCLMILKEMELAHVQPDSVTFSILIGSSEHEDDVNKYYEKLKLSGVRRTKHVFMALINAYASCGQFDKAKQVVLDKGIPVENLNEVKRWLINVLASHDHISDALGIYEELKKAGCRATPKAILRFIMYLPSKGSLSKLMDLLEDLKDTTYWIDGCYGVIRRCIQWKDLRSTIDLLKQLKDEFWDDGFATEGLFREAFCIVAEMENMDMKFGMDLLQSVKEELDVHPSRQNLDFLLSACLSGKDKKTALLIWKEYKAAGLAYNCGSYLKMYEVLLACGDREMAREMLKKIPLDDQEDPEVCCFISACKTTYNIP